MRTVFSQNFTLLMKESKSVILPGRWITHLISIDLATANPIFFILNAGSRVIIFSLFLDALVVGAKSRKGIQKNIYVLIGGRIIRCGHNDSLRESLSSMIL